MPWSSADETTCNRGYRGFAAQYRSQYGCAPPELLATAALAVGDWVGTIWRARATAEADPGAGRVLFDFEREVCAMLGVRESVWAPVRRRVLPMRSSAADAAAALRGLDPGQRALLGFHDDPPAALRPARTVAWMLLGGGLGPRDESATAFGLRTRIVAHALPRALRDRWSGLGLRPPDAAVPGAHRGAIVALERAFCGDEVHVVEPQDCAPLDPAAALDMLLTGASLRAAVRCAAVASGDQQRAA